MAINKESEKTLNQALDEMFGATNIKPRKLLVEMIPSLELKSPDFGSKISDEMAQFAIAKRLSTTNLEFMTKLFD